MRALFEEKDPEFAEQISWKTNDGNRIDSYSLISSFMDYPHQHTLGKQ